MLTAKQNLALWEVTVSALRIQRADPDLWNWSLGEEQPHSALCCAEVSVLEMGGRAGDLGSFGASGSSYGPHKCGQGDRGTN